MNPRCLKNALKCIYDPPAFIYTQISPYTVVMSFAADFGEWIEYKHEWTSICLSSPQALSIFIFSKINIYRRYIEHLRIYIYIYICRV